MVNKINRINTTKWNTTFIKKTFGLKSVRKSPYTLAFMATTKHNAIFNIYLQQARLDLHIRDSVEIEHYNTYGKKYTHVIYHDNDADTIQMIKSFVSKYDK